MEVRRNTKPPTWAEIMVEAWWFIYCVIVLGAITAQISPRSEWSHLPEVVEQILSERFLWLGLASALGIIPAVAHYWNLVRRATTFAKEALLIVASACLAVTIAMLAESIAAVVGMP